MRSRGAGVAAAIVASVVMAACSSPDGDRSVLSSAGPLMVPGASDATPVVTLIAEQDPRERAIGNIRATNTGDLPVVIRGVRLVDADNVQVGSVGLIAMDSVDGEALGAGYPVPPAPTDDDYARLERLWAGRVDAIGARVDPGEAVNLIVGLEQVDKDRCASLDSTVIEYDVDGRSEQAAWFTSYRLSTVAGDECPTSQEAILPSPGIDDETPQANPDSTPEPVQHIDLHTSGD